MRAKLWIRSANEVVPIVSVVHRNSITHARQLVAAVLLRSELFQRLKTAFVDFWKHEMVDSAENMVAKCSNWCYNFKKIQAVLAPNAEVKQLVTEKKLVCSTPLYCYPLKSIFPV